MGIETALAVGAGTSLIGGAMQADAAGNAARLQKKATDAGIAEQRRQFDLTRGDQLPFLQTGQAASLKIRDLLGLGGYIPTRSIGDITAELQKSGRFAGASQQVTNPAYADWLRQGWGDSEVRPPEQFITTPGAVDENALRQEAERIYAAQQPQSTSETGSLLKSFTPSDLVNEPGYQFGLREGNKAVENAARARGLFMAPATVKELLRYNQDYAGTKYGEAFNRDLTNRTTTYNMLSGTAGGGQVAGNTLANAGQASATNIGNLVTAGANARGAAGIAGANAYGNAFNSIGNNVMQQMYLKQLFPGGIK